MQRRLSPAVAIGAPRLRRPGAAEKVEIKIGSEAFTTATEYDAASRVDKVSYPSGFAVKYSYNATGYQHKLANAATGVTLWQADARDAEGHLTQQTAGNGVVTLQEFDANTGQLTKTLAGAAGAVQHQSYTYDALGKLVSRSDANTALAESFEYDTLNRLTKSIVSLTPTPLVATFSYNAIGNLTFKSDVGAYNYPAPGQPRPHGVASVTGGSINATFTYDAKGNLVAGNGLTVTYTASNKEKTITRGTATVAFDPGLRRGRPRPRAPALRPDRPQRRDALPLRHGRAGGALRPAPRAAALDQLPDGGRAADRHPGGERRRDHADALLPHRPLDLDDRPGCPQPVDRGSRVAEILLAGEISSQGHG